MTSPAPAGGETDRLTRVLVKHARDAFASREAVEAQWRHLNFTSAPELSRARAEYDEFVRLVASGGADVLFLPADPTVGLDSIYTRDAAVVAPGGLVLGRMGKPARASEPAALGRACGRLGVAVVGAIEPPGTLEGGDVLWLDDRTVAIGRGYRTNDEGIEQYRAILGGAIDDCLIVPLPHWRGPADVFHLMSIISPVDRDLAVVYAPLLPVPFREALIARGIALVEVPDDEFESMGANVLAIGPRDVIMLEGNPVTQARLEQAGARVRTYRGMEISLKGGGGPTCLTRPVGRAEGKGQRAKGGTEG